MADRAISELYQATTVTPSDNFVLEQANSAKRLTGETLKTYLLQWIDGHGGISSIAKTSTSGLVDTYTITFAGDNTTTTFTVTNGKGIASIAKTGTQDLVDTYTVTFNDNTTWDYEVTNGEKGDQGDACYLWVMYSEEYPVQDSDMHGTPDNWMGFCANFDTTAPEHYNDYLWFEIKGEKGDKGDDILITGTEVKYLVYDTGSGEPPSDGQDWQSTIPTVPSTKYLWSRTRVSYSDGTVTTSYISAYQPRDGGGGTVQSVNNIHADENYNVTLPTDNVPTALSDNYVKSGGVHGAIADIRDFDVSVNATVDSTITVTDARITQSHKIRQEMEIWDADISWDTYDGGAQLTCSMGFPAMKLSFYLPK